MDVQFEVVVLPVADVERAKDFCGLGLTPTLPFDSGFRAVQFTRQGSGGSIQFGTNMTSAAPGWAQGLCLIVSDVGEARGDLAGHGEHESRIGAAGPDWPGWCGACLAAERAGTELPR